MRKDRERFSKVACCRCSHLTATKLAAFVKKLEICSRSQEGESCHLRSLCRCVPESSVYFQMHNEELLCRHSARPTDGVVRLNIHEKLGQIHASFHDIKEKNTIFCVKVNCEARSSQSHFKGNRFTYREKMHETNH